MEETNILGENPNPYGIWATSCCERHSGERCASTLAARFSCQAVRAWPITLGTRHQIHAFESQAVAEVPRTAEGGSRAPRQVADLCVLTVLFKPTRPRLSYAYTENLVPDPAHLFTDLRDMNSLHGQTGFGRSWSCWSPAIVTKMRTSEPGERSVVVLTLIASLAILSPS